jgi:hypothetical protein
MEHEGSLLYSQQPATVPYPEPDVSNPHRPSHFPKIHSKDVSICKGKGKVVPVLLTEHHAMKAYWEVEV